jgi:hypothetical protein
VHPFLTTSQSQACGVPARPHAAVSRVHSAFPAHISFFMQPTSYSTWRKQLVVCRSGVVYRASTGLCATNDIDACSRGTRAYSKSEMDSDFSPYNAFRGESNCKLISSGLEILLKKGCYGTVAGVGCGLYGRAPIATKPKTATLEFTCVLLLDKPSQCIASAPVAGVRTLTCKNG